MYGLLRRQLVLVFAAALVVRPASADVTRFDLSGIVTDATGGVLPGVTVAARNTDTGFTRSAVTDAAGRYNFAALESTGKWSLTAELEGFRTQVREGLQFQANTKPEINLELAVGAMSEVVTVDAQAPLVRTTPGSTSSIRSSGSSSRTTGRCTRG